MAHTLVIDDETGGFETLERMLTLAGHEFTGAATGREGVRLAKELQPEVAVIDLVLPDISGLQVCDEIRGACAGTACVMLSGQFGLPGLDFDARALGIRVVSKPIWGDDFIHMIEQALVSRPRDNDSGADTCDIYLEPPIPYAMARIADAGVCFIGSSQDEPKLSGVCNAIFVAPGTLRNWCKTAHLKAKAVRDFLRALRAVYVLAEFPYLRSDLGNVLKIVDDRTIERFCVKAGGTGGRSPALPVTVDDLLDRQTFIDNPTFVAAVRSAVQATSVRAAEPHCV